LLVEGDTELGAMPVLSRKMDLDFDNYGISVIAAGSSYFADFMDLLERFEISHIAICDKDVLTNITSSIKVSTLDIITSILIKQLDDLNKLSDDDKRSS
jgi:putative ATP-dependent endonuclease of the OLD family